MNRRISSSWRFVTVFAFSVLWVNIAPDNCRGQTVHPLTEIPGNPTTRDAADAIRATHAELRSTAIQVMGESPQITYDTLKHLPSYSNLTRLTKEFGLFRDAASDPATGGYHTYAELSPRTKSLEAIIGSNGPHYLPVAFLEGGARCQRSAARIIFKTKYTYDAENTFFPGDAWGTGFLVAPSLFMTNNHVLPAADFARDKVQAQFNFQRDLDGIALPTEEYDFDPDSFFYTSVDLDYTVVRIKPRHVTSGTPPLAIDVTASEHWGFLHIEMKPLLFLPTPNSNEPKQRLNIVEHPRGRYKEIAIQNNFLDKLDANFVRYTTDTEPGSSGSPVFNNSWQLVALHHSAGDQDATTQIWKNNEGIRIDAIAKDLTTHAAASVAKELGL